MKGLYLGAALVVWAFVAAGFGRTFDVDPTATSSGTYMPSPFDGWQPAPPN